MDINTKEKELLYVQSYASVIFIITIFVSLILTINNIKKQNNTKKLFDNETENQINFINRIIITILAITFTYINYNFYEISKQRNNVTIQKDEYIASLLTLIAGFILLYTTVQSIKNNMESLNIDSPLI